MPRARDLLLLLLLLRPPPHASPSTRLRAAHAHTRASRSGGQPTPPTLLRPRRSYARAQLELIALIELQEWHSPLAAAPNAAAEGGPLSPSALYERSPKCRDMLVTLQCLIMHSAPDSQSMSIWSMLAFQRSFTDIACATRDGSFSADADDDDAEAWEEWWEAREEEAARGAPSPGDISLSEMDLSGGSARSAGSGKSSPQLATPTGDELRACCVRIQELRWVSLVEVTRTLSRTLSRTLTPATPTRALNAPHQPYSR